MEGKDTQKRKKSIIIINDKGETETVSKKTPGKSCEDVTCPRESGQMGAASMGMGGPSRGEECREKCKQESEEAMRSKDSLGGGKEASAGSVREAESQSSRKEDAEESKASAQCPNEPQDETAGMKMKDVPAAASGGSSASVPPMLDTSAQDANKEIFKDREDGKIAAEGWMWKKRRIFSCFWHQKYFVLTRDGVLRYHKADGRRDAKGNWNMKESTEIRHYNLPSGDKYPFRILVFFPSHSFLLAFDDRDAKDHWVEKLNEAIENKQA